MIQCTDCKQTFAVEFFYKNQSRCKGCGNKRAYAWRRANPERARELMVAGSRKYRSLNRLKCLLTGARHKAKQRGHAPPDDPTRDMPVECEACGKEASPLRLDHCHQTGKFRGWLCNECNLAIGLLGDSPQKMRAAADYIERHKSGVV